ncbi:unnamed protein product [Adineta ricciae]|uniref:G-protein coupled receptors family 1 profile domain-containing protein n=1 Tax=Adineta ricciae TaxID=249248 RepID=A0A816A2H8_ADIRI|nr:unnamed protein product [Adineta ricciae]
MYTGNNTFVEEISITTYPILFSILLAALIPSILCSLLIFVYFFSHWRTSIINSLHNHPIFLLSITSFLYNTLDLPFTMNTYRTGSDTPRNPTFCLWWFWFDYTLLAVNLYLAMISSIQRHILIFHSHWLRFHRLRWILHYIPLIFGVVYPSCFYLVVIYLYPCEISYDDASQYCLYPCYLDVILAYTLDWIFNIVLPVLMNGFANFILVMRVMRSMKKVRQQQRNTWKKQKRLTITLLVYSLLYFLLWLPAVVMTIVKNNANKQLLENIPDLYYLYYIYVFICPLQPFMCVLALPELVQTIKQRQRARRIIAPEVPLTIGRTGLQVRNNQWY